MIKKQKHLMTLNALRDPSDVNALFGDDDDDDDARKALHCHLASMKKNLSLKGLQQVVSSGV